MRSDEGGLRRIVVATRNPGKLREIREILSRVPAVLVPVSDFDVAEVEETGETFEDNAGLKALAVARATGSLAIADDSGLAVPALGGEPGVRSSRYSPEGTDERNNALLLGRVRELSLVEPEARFVCVAVLASPDGILESVRGEAVGVLLDEPRGENGFGYDPLFFSPELGKTFAQASSVEKGSVSHRGRAFRKLAESLLRLLEEA
ncbi:MAG: RdgB/HAM1 family non-canonical purine NTP pyrophosphatase [Planctomycetota bacterium]|jgi:XTP/dITP diphosphohydrolase